MFTLPMRNVGKLASARLLLSRSAGSANGSARGCPAKRQLRHPGAARSFVTERGKTARGTRLTKEKSTMLPESTVTGLLWAEVANGMKQLQTRKRLVDARLRACFLPFSLQVPVRSRWLVLLLVRLGSLLLCWLAG